MAALLGEDVRKINPRLRMIANCSTEVNAFRAERSGYISVKASPKLNALPMLRGSEPLALKREQLSAQPQFPKLKGLAKDVYVNVFVETQEAGEAMPNVLKGQATRANLIAATVRVDQLPAIAGNRRVLSIELGETLTMPTPDVVASTGSPEATRWRFGSADDHGDGAGVLIGIIDVQGFDFAHPDFMDGDQTRFVRIWDQGGTARPNPHQQDPDRYGKEYNCGAEFRREHLNQAIRQAAQLNLPPQEIERQSQMSPSSHATHVASIAAGNHGICRKALLAGVLIDLAEDPADPQLRRQSFYDSTRIAQAVDYLLQVANELKVPVSINISLGTNGSAHDGTAAISRWIDAALTAPGRSICVAAGNAGQEVPVFPGDLGFVMGRIHTSGKVSDRYLSKDIQWSVIGNGRVDVSENELEIWYSEQDRFAVSVLPPFPDADWIGPVDPQEFIENLPLPDGSLLSIYNELYHPSNGNNYIAVYLTPYFGEEAVIGIPAGNWTVRLHGLDVRDGRYHGWIERDDPRPLGRVGSMQAWRFPSFFSETSNVDDSSVGSMACGRRVIAVANLHETEERINITSSQGPTRDNRYKPDVAAPGTDILAANGFAGPGEPWVKMSGTSMASPYVAGVIGLMLAVEPRLTAAQIEGILHRTSRPLPGKSFAWANDAGFGIINPSACLKEAKSINQRIPYQP